MTDDAFYKTYPATCDPKDFWGQVKRTVDGKPVSRDQIDMIVQAVKQGLNLRSTDVLLDLCCGNGALSTLLFAHCGGGLGVDYSPFLIDVAKANFETDAHRFELVDDVVQYLAAPQGGPLFSRALCYGSFQYIPAGDALAFLRHLHDNFAGVDRLYIGNLPDKEQMHDFFKKGAYTPGVEDDHASAIGIWRSRDEFSSLAGRAGWEASFHTMPENFYAHAYRYDAVLVRKGE